MAIMFLTTVLHAITSNRTTLSISCTGAAYVNDPKVLQDDLADWLLSAAYSLI